MLLPGHWLDYGLGDGSPCSGVLTGRPISGSCPPDSGGRHRLVRAWGQGRGRPDRAVLPDPEGVATISALVALVTFKVA